MVLEPTLTQLAHLAREAWELARRLDEVEYGTTSCLFDNVKRDG